MQFSVIYSVDVPAQRTRSATSLPPMSANSGIKTEGDEQYEYSYLEGEWKRGHHRKWCAILTKEQFEEFIDHCGLFAERRETMGALVACIWLRLVVRQFHFVLMIAMQSQCAYVTPIPEVRKAAR